MSKRITTGDIKTEGELSNREMNTLSGAAAKTTTKKTETKSKGHDHETDGIHDDNNRTGNNGLGSGSKTKSAADKKKAAAEAAAAKKKADAEKKAAEAAAAAKLKRKGGMTSGEGAEIRDDSYFSFKRTGKGAKDGQGADLDVDTVIGSERVRWDPIVLDLDGDKKISTQAKKESTVKQYAWEKAGYDWGKFGAEKIDWNDVNATWAARTDEFQKQQGFYNEQRDLGLQGLVSSYSYSYSGSYSGSNYYSYYNWSGSYSGSWQGGANFDIAGRKMSTGWASNYDVKYGKEGVSSHSNSLSGVSDRTLSWNKYDYDAKFTANSGSTWMGKWDVKYDYKATTVENADVNLFSTGGRQFDLNGDSTLDRMTWVGGKDAFLAIDWNANGRIDSGIELFGGRTNDGVRELRFLDTNYDGKVNSKDKDWSKLKLLKADGSLVELSSESISEFSVGDTAKGKTKAEKAAEDAAAAAKTKTSKSKTAGGSVTNDPSAKNSKAHNHQTDGIHDDNNRIGNNGLGGGKKEDDGKLPTVTAGEGAQVIDGTTFRFTRKDGSRGIGVDLNLDIVDGKRDSERMADLQKWWQTDEGRAWRRMDPVALDLDGDNKISTSAFKRREGLMGRWGGGKDAQWNFEGGMAGFDMNFDHLNDRTTWVAGADAFLAIDWNRNSRIDSGAELFGPRTDDGIRELREMDSNLDGVVDKGDKNFSLLKVVSAEKERQWFWDSAKSTWSTREVTSENRFKTSSLDSTSIVSFEIGLDSARRPKAATGTKVTDAAGTTAKGKAAFGSDGKTTAAAKTPAKKK